MAEIGPVVVVEVEVVRMGASMSGSGSLRVFGCKGLAVKVKPVPGIEHVRHASLATVVLASLLFEGHLHLGHVRFDQILLNHRCDGVTRKAQSLLRVSRPTKVLELERTCFFGTVLVAVTGAASREKEKERERERERERKGERERGVRTHMSGLQHEQ